MGGLKRLFGGGRKRGGGGGGGGGDQTFAIEEEDRAAFDQLTAGGLDVSKPVRVSHSIAFADREAADAAAEKVRGRGFDAQVSPGDADHGPLLVASQTATVTLQDIADMRGRLTRFASRHGGEYEGWKAV